jgi:hypothetical protein
MKRSDRAMKKWCAKIKEQQASGQEPSAYCQQRSICSTSFYSWRKRLGMKGLALGPATISQPLLSRPEKQPGAGFLRLDPAGVAMLKDPMITQHSRVMWIDTPEGYRVAVNGGMGLTELFGLLRTL